MGTLRQQYGKPLNLSLNPEDDSNLGTMLDILNLAPEHSPRLKAALQGGVPHQVLNARRHTEESQIIAGAGAFGAVTIATNMAGRGVDIKLGGDMAEEVVSSVNRVLRKAGYSDPYDMTLQERRKAIQDMDPALYGIYDIEVNYFLQYFDDMEMVKLLAVCTSSARNATKPAASTTSCADAPPARATPAPHAFTCRSKTT